MSQEWRDKSYRRPYHGRAGHDSHKDDYDRGRSRDHGHGDGSNRAPYRENRNFDDRRRYDSGERYHRRSRSRSPDHHERSYNSYRGRNDRERRRRTRSRSPDSSASSGRSIHDRPISVTTINPAAGSSRNLSNIQPYQHDRQARSPDECIKITIGNEKAEQSKGPKENPATMSLYDDLSPIHDTGFEQNLREMDRSTKDKSIREKETFVGKVIKNDLTKSRSNSPHMISNLANRPEKKDMFEDERQIDDSRKLDYVKHYHTEREGNKERERNNSIERSSHGRQYIGSDKGFNKNSNDNWRAGERRSPTNKRDSYDDQRNISTSRQSRPVERSVERERRWSPDSDKRNLYRENRSYHNDKRSPDRDSRSPHNHHRSPHRSPQRDRRSPHAEYLSSNRDCRSLRRDHRSPYREQYDEKRLERRDIGDRREDGSRIRPTHEQVDSPQLQKSYSQTRSDRSRERSLQKEMHQSQSSGKQNYQFNEANRGKDKGEIDDMFDDLPEVKLPPSAKPNRPGQVKIKLLEKNVIKPGFSVGDGPDEKNGSKSIPVLNTISSMNIEDEEAFLYGDITNPVTAPSPREPQNIASVTESPFVEKERNSASDPPISDYRGNISRQDSNFNSEKQQRDDDRRYNPEAAGAGSHYDRNQSSGHQRPEQGAGAGSHHDRNQSSGHQRPEQGNFDSTTETVPTEKNSDPTIKNILKSIGFNFELSKLMQQRAEDERIKGEKKEDSPDRYGVAHGSSFMEGGLKNMDIGGVFDEKMGKPAVPNLDNMSYEEKARLYREELSKAQAQGRRSPSPPLDLKQHVRLSREEFSKAQAQGRRSPSPPLDVRHHAMYREDFLKTQEAQRRRSRSPPLDPNQHATNLRQYPNLRNDMQQGSQSTFTGMTHEPYVGQTITSLGGYNASHGHHVSGEPTSYDNRNPITSGFPHTDTTSHSSRSPPLREFRKGSPPRVGRSHSPDNRHHSSKRHSYSRRRSSSSSSSSSSTSSSSMSHRSYSPRDRRRRPSSRSRSHKRDRSYSPQSRKQASSRGHSPVRRHRSRSYSPGKRRESSHSQSYSPGRRRDRSHSPPYSKRTHLSPKEESPAVYKPPQDMSAPYPYSIQQPNVPGYPPTAPYPQYGYPNFDPSQPPPMSYPPPTWNYEMPYVIPNVPAPVSLNPPIVNSPSPITYNPNLKVITPQEESPPQKSKPDIIKRDHPPITNQQPIEEIRRVHIDRSLPSGSAEKTSRRTVLPPRQSSGERKEDMKRSLSGNHSRSPSIESDSYEKPKIKRARKERAEAFIASMLAKTGETALLKERKENTAAQRKKIAQEMEERQKRLSALERELDRLRKQESDMMRKKKRQRDGHKDPLILENSKLQEEITKQMSLLRKAAEMNERLQSNSPDVHSTVNAGKGGTPEHQDVRIIEKKTDQSDDMREKEKKQELVPAISKEEGGKWQPIVQKEEKREEKRERKKDNETEIVKKVEKPVKERRGPTQLKFKYYDPGDHWCKRCNVVGGSATSLLQHLQSNQHMKTVDLYDRPWPSDGDKNASNATPSPNVLIAEFRGAEFLMPARAFYCTLCRVFMGDVSCGEEHLKTHSHNEKYRAYLDENPLYEKRRNLDKAAAVSAPYTEKQEDTPVVKKEPKEPKEEKRKNVPEKSCRKETRDARKETRDAKREVESKSQVPVQEKSWPLSESSKSVPHENTKGKKPPKIPANVPQKTEHEKIISVKSEKMEVEPKKDDDDKRKKVTLSFIGKMPGRVKGATVNPLKSAQKTTAKSLAVPQKQPSFLGKQKAPPSADANALLMSGDACFDSPAQPSPVTRISGKRDNVAVKNLIGCSNRPMPDKVSEPDNKTDAGQPLKYEGMLVSHGCSETEGTPAVNTAAENVPPSIKALLSAHSSHIEQIPKPSLESIPFPAAMIKSKGSDLQTNISQKQVVTSSAQQELTSHQLPAFSKNITAPVLASNVSSTMTTNTIPLPTNTISHLVGPPPAPVAMQPPVATIQTPVANIYPPVPTIQAPVGAIPLPVAAIQAPVMTTPVAMQAPVSKIYTPAPSIQAPVATIQPPVLTIHPKGHDSRTDINQSQVFTSSTQHQFPTVSQNITTPSLSSNVASMLSNSTIPLPSLTIQRLVGAPLAPVETMQASVAPIQAPVAPIHVPVATTETPVASIQMPIATTQMPASTMQAPVATMHPSVTQEEADDYKLLGIDPNPYLQHIMPRRPPPISVLKMRKKAEQPVSGDLDCKKLGSAVSASKTPMTPPTTTTSIDPVDECTKANKATDIFAVEVADSKDSGGVLFSGISACGSSGTCDTSCVDLQQTVPVVNRDLAQTAVTAESSQRVNTGLELPSTSSVNDTVDNNSCISETSPTADNLSLLEANSSTIICGGGDSSSKSNIVSSQVELASTTSKSSDFIPDKMIDSNLLSDNDTLLLVSQENKAEIHADLTGAVDSNTISAALPESRSSDTITTSEHKTEISICEKTVSDLIVVESTATSPTAGCDELVKSDSVSEKDSGATVSADIVEDDLAPVSRRLRSRGPQKSPARPPPVKKRQSEKATRKSVKSKAEDNKMMETQSVMEQSEKSLNESQETMTQNIKDESDATMKVTPTQCTEDVGENSVEKNCEAEQPNDKIMSARVVISPLNAENSVEESCEAEQPSDKIMSTRLVTSPLNTDTFSINLDDLPIDKTTHPPCTETTPHDVDALLTSAQPLVVSSEPRPVDVESSHASTVCPQGAGEASPEHEELSLLNSGIPVLESGTVTPLFLENPLTGSVSDEIVNPIDCEISDGSIGYVKSSVDEITVDIIQSDNNESSQDTIISSGEAASHVNVNYDIVNEMTEIVVAVAKEQLTNIPSSPVKSAFDNEGNNVIKNSLTSEHLLLSSTFDGAVTGENSAVGVSSMSDDNDVADTLEMDETLQSLAKLEALSRTISGECVDEENILSDNAGSSAS